MNSMLYRKLCSHRNTIVIFDEIHHCGDQKTFGYGIKDGFTGAKEKLLLSGTPWKTDGQPIPFVQYDVDGFPMHDFRYDYPSALNDDVVRWLTFYYNGGLIRYDDDTVENFDRNITEEEASKRLRKILNPRGDFIRSQISQAHRNLLECRKQMPDAAAMAACIDKDHAVKIAAVIKDETGCEPSVIVSDGDDAHANDSVKNFKRSTKEWLVAVRQVSEGTDIKRLQVLCYFSNYATEVFFRQIIGRVSRRRYEEDKEAYVYLPADPRLLRFAENIMRAQVRAVLKEAAEGEPCERGEREQSIDNYWNYSTIPSGEDVIFIGDVEYSATDAKKIEEIKSQFGVSMKVAANIFHVYGDRDLGGQQIGRPEQHQPSLEEEVMGLRRECSRLVNCFASLIGKEPREIYRKFPKRHNEMTKDQLLARKKNLIEMINEVRREKERRKK